MSRFQQFAMVAADEAMRGCRARRRSTTNCLFAPACIIGSGIGSMSTMEEQYTVLMERGPSRVSPFVVPMMISDLAAGHVSIRYDLQRHQLRASCLRALPVPTRSARPQRSSAGVTLTWWSPAGSTPASRRSAWLALRPHGPCRHATMTQRAPLARGILGATASSWPRAEVCWFSRTGTTRSHAAPTFALNSSATAPPRMRTTSPHRRLTATERFARCNKRWRRRGSSRPTSTTSTRTAPRPTLGDIAETNAIKAVFGSDAPLVSSTKSMMGHMLGGAGAAEAAVCVLAMEHGRIPPTINLTDPDPACDLDYVPNVARAVELGVTMSNSFGFGGHNATLVFAKP